MVDKIMKTTPIRAVHHSHSNTPIQNEKVCNDNLPSILHVKAAEEKKRMRVKRRASRCIYTFRDSIEKIFLLSQL